MVIIMNRYNNINILKDSTGRRFRRTVKYPIIEPHVDDTYIMGSIGDRLDTLAHMYYKDSTLWWIIAEANGIGKGDLVVPSGIQIRIPSQVSTILKEYNDINSYGS